MYGISGLSKFKVGLRVDLNDWFCFVTYVGFVCGLGGWGL